MEMTAKDAGSILSHMDMEIGVLMQQRSAIKYIGAVIKLGEEKQKVIDTFEDTKAMLDQQISDLTQKKEKAEQRCRASVGKADEVERKLETLQAEYDRRKATLDEEM